MKLRTTLILLFLVAGASVFFVLHTAKQRRLAQHLEQQQRVFPSREYEDPATRKGLADMIIRLELRNPSQTIAIARDDLNDAWHISKPLPTTADRGQLAPILNELEFLKSVTVLRADTQGELDLAEYGLRDPAHSITFHTRDGSWTLDIGNPTPDGNTVYASRPDATEPLIYVVPATILGKAAKSVSELREKAALPFDKSTVTRVTVNVAGAAPVVCQKQGMGWQLTQPVEDDADTSALSALIENLAALRVDKADFITENPRPLADYGLEEPALTLTLGEGKHTRALHVGSPLKENPRKVYARRTIDGALFAISRDGADRLRKSPRELRSKRVLQFAPRNVTAVEVDLPYQTVRLSRTGQQWTMQQPAGRVPDEEQLIRFLRELQDLPVEGRLDTPEEKAHAVTGLDRPRVTLTLRFLDGTSPPRVVRFGKTDESGARCYAQRGGQAGILLVPAHFAQKAAAGHLAFLPKTMLEFNQAHATDIRIERPDGNYALTRENGKWSLREPARTAADPDAVANLLWTLSHLESKRIVAEKPFDAARYGLEPARIKVAISLATPRREGKQDEPRRASQGVRKVLLIGKQAGPRLSYAMLEGGEYVFLIGDDTVRNLMAEFASTAVLTTEADRIATVFDVKKRSASAILEVMN